MQRSRTQHEDANHQLIRELVVRNRSSDELVSAPPGAMPGEEILVNVELDGIRYRLVRDSTNAHSAADSSLTPREMEIARMVALGYANKTIAAVLEISSWTVATHLRHVFAKLGVTTRAAMVTRMLCVADQPGRRTDSRCGFANESRTEPESTTLSKRGALRKRAAAGGSSASGRTAG